MFFPDLRKGVKEMGRVTALGGRIVATFWAGIEHSPYMAATFLSMDQALPQGSMDFMQQAFRLNRDGITAVFRETRLKGITAETIEEIVSLPPIAEFLPGYVASLPCSSEFEALSPADRQFLYDGINHELATYIQADGTVLVPFTVHLVSGIR